VLYVALVAIVVPVLMYFYNGYVQAAKKTEVASRVELEGRRIVSQVTHVINAAASVSAPAIDASAGSLSLTSDPGFSYTQINSSSGNMFVVDGSGTHQINSDEMVISNVLFSRIDGADNSEAIRFSFQIEPNTSSIRNEFLYTKSFSGQVNIYE
jgi:hypothetical protein